MALDSLDFVLLLLLLVLVLLLLLLLLPSAHRVSSGSRQPVSFLLCCTAVLIMTTSFVYCSSPAERCEGMALNQGNCGVRESAFGLKVCLGFWPVQRSLGR